MDSPFKRPGSVSNAHVGQVFEACAQRFFAERGLQLQCKLSVAVGVSEATKPHAFDLGSNDPKVLVECKSHRWTSSGNIPSAKLTVWNEAMFYFHVAPSGYRRIMFVLKDLRHGSGESLVHYYLRTYGHLVPDGVEFWEYSESARTAERVGP